MRFTAYGKRLAAHETKFETDATGATAHVLACQYDAGVTILLTGQDAHGRRIRRVAHSVFGAWAMARAAWGIRRAWHIAEDGRRRLIFER